MTNKERNLLELAAHPDTPVTEALAAARALKRLVDKNPDADIVVRSYNAHQQEVRALEAEIAMLREIISDGGDSMDARNEAIRRARKGGATYAELKRDFGLGRTQLSKIING